MIKKVAYQQGYKYKLVEDYSIQLSTRPHEAVQTRWIDFDADGLLLIRAGYAWDGATGMPDSPDIIRGSLVHDALYQLMRDGLLDLAYKDDADMALYLMCIEDGMQPVLARVVFGAVQQFGMTRLVANPRLTLYAPPDPAVAVFHDHEGG